MENKSIERSVNFDCIRTLAILFVICIHSMGEMEQVISSVHCGTLTKIVGALLNSIIHSGVPLFVMLSGALLLNKNEPISLLGYMFSKIQIFYRSVMLNFKSHKKKKYSNVTLFYY